MPRAFPDPPEGWDPEQVSMVGEAIWDAITQGADWDPDTDDDWMTNANELLEWGGGVRATARAIGVPYTTFRGWFNGVTPSARYQDRLQRAVREIQAGGSERLNRMIAAGGATLRARASLGGKNRSSPFYVGRDTWAEANNASGGGPMGQRLIDAYRNGATPYDLGAIYGSGMQAAVDYMDELDIYSVDDFSFYYE